MPLIADPRSDLRTSLAFTPSQRVIIAPGVSSREAGHEDAVWVGSILRLIDDRFRILIWGRGNRVDRAVQRAIALNQPDTVCVAERQLHKRIDQSELFGVADAALFLGADAQTGDLIEQCSTAGLPIVAVSGPAVFERFKTASNFMLVPKFSPPAVAEQILRLFDGKP